MTVPLTRVPPGCQHVGDKMSDYLDGDLGDPDRWEVKRHLEACAGCARLAAELAATVSALHRLGRSSGVRFEKLPERGPDR